ncbi:MAG: DegV family protein [Eubacteriales bacterium]
MIVIVTDSSACITRQEARKLGVVCVPMTYTVAGTMYTERFVNENGNYTELIAGTKELHTSQSSAATFLRIFSGLRNLSHEILCLNISSRLSGTFGNASMCARELGGEGIRVIDTQSSAGGILIMIKEARRLIDLGYSLDQVAKAMMHMRDRVRVVFSVADMMPLRRSGRLGPVRQSIGTILNLRPLFTCKEGAVVTCGVARGRNEQRLSLIKSVPADAEEIMVQYACERKEAESIAKALEEKCSKPVQLRQIGPVLGIHLGLDVIGTIWLEANSRLNELEMSRDFKK